MPQKCYHFYFSKIVYFWYLVTVSNFNVLYVWTIFCICSVGNWYNYSELVFCKDVKILLCLHFATFKTYNCMFSGFFSIVKQLWCTKSILKNIFLICFLIQEFVIYMSIWRIPLKPVLGGLDSSLQLPLPSWTGPIKRTL
jgi:hypothetical protein